MNGGRRLTKPSGCAKQCYRNRKVALQKAAEATKRTGEPIKAYRCVLGCHGFHIGHAPGWKEANGR